MVVMLMEETLGRRCGVYRVAPNTGVVTPLSPTSSSFVFPWP
ncbi:hypothetical protein SOVF_178550 isoform B [Spinacia oleracea]|nr:hypothetical protein SOVF_178550 isoform B [Spinacia oleracea]